MLTKLCFYTFIIIFPCFLFGQSYLGKVTHFGIEQGLSHRDVQCIHQDRQGLLWLGTKYGLNRFDGKTFRWYTKEKHGFQSNEINHILEDKDGLFWLIQSGSFMFKSAISIDLFDPIQEQTISFENFFGNNAPFVLSDIRNFAVNKKGNLVFLMQDNRFIIYDGQFRSFSFQLGNHNSQQLYWTDNDWIWLVTKEISASHNIKQLLILAFDFSGKEMRRFEHPGFDAGFIYHLDHAGNCEYLISKSETPNQVLSFFTDKSEGSQLNKKLQSALTRQKLENRALGEINLVAKHQSLFWISEGNRGPELEPNLKVFASEGSIDIQWDKAYKNISHATSLCFDNLGNTWVGTQFGVYRIRLVENHFSKLLQQQNGENIPVRGMAIDANEYLWVVEESLADFWKINLNSLEESHANKTAPAQKQLPFDYSYFIGLGKGQDGLFYYFSANKLVQFRPETYDFQAYVVGESALAWGTVWTIYEDEFGKIWYTTNQGELGYWDGDETNWLPPLDTIQGPFYIYQFLKDKNGQTWLVTDAGLFILNTEKKKITARYWSGGTQNYYLPFDNFFHLHEDDQGHFWLGTKGDGLVKWDRPGLKGTWQQFTKAHGLSNNNIYAVYPDEYDNLWLSSDFGLMRFNKSSQSCQAFLEEDGITHNEFNRISHYKTPDGQLFFGSLNGVTALHPKDFQEDSILIHPPLIISDYQHYNEAGKLVEDKKDKLLNNSSIRLLPNDRFFRLEFALLTYVDVDKNQYAYKVEGVDKGWTYQKENHLRFSRLPYGEYTLRIKGQAANGQWSKNELAIKLEVLKPFYLQSWFLVLVVVSIIGGAFIFYKWRVGNLKKRQKELETIVATRTKELREDKKIIESQNETLGKQAEELQSLERLKSRFFANVSHELRTPLSLLLGPVNTILKRNEVKPKDRQLLQFTQRNANQLLKLINEILDLSKLEAGKLSLHETPVHFHKYLTELLAQFHSFADSESVIFSLEYNVREDLQILIDKDKVEKIIQNYLSNALKYSPPKSKVTLSVKEEENHIQLYVQDAGPGIHREDLPHIFDRFYQSKKDTSTPKGGTGIGLSLVKELAELLGGKVWAESELRKGSVFYFQFPKKVADSSLMLAGLDSESKSLQIENPPPLKEQEPELSPETKPATSNQQLATILLVEDNPDLREYIKIVLSDYKVITAENGKAGLEILNQELTEGTKQNEAKSADCEMKTIDLIISDLMMPVMDGFEFLENVKANDQWRHIPVIMLTAKVNVVAKLNALRIGVDDYLTKPFVEEELQARVKNMLHNYNQRMELFSNNGTPEKLLEARPVIAQVDAEWLEGVEQIFNKFLSDGNFKIDLAAHHLNISLRQFQRRIKQITGLAAHQYLLEMRLQKTKDFLTEGKYATVKEVAYSVGFRDTKYFSSTFKKRFGLTPSAYFK